MISARLTFSKIIRTALSNLPIDLFNGTARPFGISAIVRLWNENETLEASLASLESHVEEIIVVDTGSNDGSAEKAQELAKKYTKIRFFCLNTRLPWEYSNFAIEKTRFRWILKWDADFIDIDESEGGVNGLRKYLASLKRTRYYYLKLPVIELAGDFNHQFPNIRTRSDVEVFTWSPATRFLCVDTALKKHPFHYSLPDQYINDKYHVKLEGLKIPLYYRIIRYAHPLAFHLNIKDPIRWLHRHFWLEWLAEDMTRFPRLEEYTEFRVKNGWGFRNVASAANFLMNEICKSLVPYDQRLGNLPPPVRYLRQVDNRHVVYQNGKIIGRSDSL